MFNGLFIVGWEEESGDYTIIPYQLKDAQGNPVLALFTDWERADRFIKSVDINWGLDPEGMPEYAALEALLENHHAGVSGFAINPESLQTLTPVPLAMALGQLCYCYYNEGVRDERAGETMLEE